MLAYNDDQGIVGKRNTLDITPVVCDGRKRFVCERALDLPGRKYVCIIMFILLNKMV